MELAHPERVLGSAGGLQDLHGPIFGWPLASNYNKGCNDEVHGNRVEDAFGGPWEVGEQTAAKADDHRFCHAEAANPAGERLGPARFDDRWPHDAERNVAA